LCTGRVHVITTLGKHILSIMFNAFDQSGTNWFSIIVIFGIVLSWVVGYVRLSPMIHGITNDVSAALGVALGWAMLGVALERLVVDQNLTSMVIIGVPLSFVFAVYVVRYHRVSVCRQPLQDVDSLYDIDLWARSRLQLFQRLQVDGDDAARIQDAWSSGGGAKAAPGSSAARQHGLASAVARSIGSAGSAGQRGAAVHLASQVIIRLGASYAEDNSMTTVLAAEVELAYQTIMDKFPSSSMGHLLAATYFRLTHPSRYMEMHALNTARKSNAPVDVSFFIFQRTKDLIDRDTSYTPTGALRNGVAGAKAITPVDRLTYEHELQTAFAAETSCYRALMRVWDALQEPVPDLAELQRMGELLWRSIDQAEGRFKVLLTMNPEGISVLRAYASFQRNLLHNATTAHELDMRAGALVEAASRANKHLVPRFELFSKAPDLGFMDEGVAMVTISVEVSRVGEILSVNSAGCRLFGRNRSDLVGSNISVIMPKPISTVHDQFLLKYTRTGAARFVNNTMQVLVQQTNGFILPCRMHLRETAPTMADTSPRISAVLEPMAVGEHMILFGSEDEEFQIYSADAASHELMDTDPELLEDIGASVITYFPAVHPGYVNLDELDFDEAQGSARSRGTMGEGGGGAYNAPPGASVGVSHGNNNHSLLHASGFVKTPVRVDEGGMGMDDFGMEDDGDFGGGFEDDANHLQVMAHVQTLNMPSLGGKIYLLQWRRTEEDLAAEAAAAAEEARMAREGTMAAPAHKTVGPPPMMVALDGGDGDSQSQTGDTPPHSELRKAAPDSKEGGLRIRAPLGATNPLSVHTGAVTPAKHPEDSITTEMTSHVDALAASAAASRLSAHSMLVRKVIEAQRLMTEGAIVSMRRILYALFTLVLLLGITLLAVLPQGAALIRQHTMSLHDGGRRALLVRHASEQVMGMRAVTDVAFPLAVPNSTFAAQQALLSGVTLELDSVQEALSSDIQELGSTQLDFERARTVSVVSSSGNVAVQSPSEAAQDLLSKLHVLRFISASEFVSGGQLSTFAVEVMANTGTLAASFDAAYTAKLTDAVTYVNNLGQLELVAMVVIFMVVFLAIAVSFFVLVRRLAVKRLSALSVFLQVPPGAVKHMRDSTGAQLSAHLKRVAQETQGDVDVAGGADEEEEEEGAGGGGDAEEDVRRGLTAGGPVKKEASGNPRSTWNDAQALVAESATWDSFFSTKARGKAAQRLGLSGGTGAQDSAASARMAARSARAGGSRQLAKRRGTDTANWMWWTILKVQAPVASLVLWLGLVYAMEFLAQTQVQQEVTRLYYAQHTQTLGLGMTFNATSLLTATTPAERLAAESNLVLLEAQHLAELQAILSGTEFLSTSNAASGVVLEPLLDDRQEFSLLMINACQFFAAESCATFSSGVLASGLVPGVHSYLSQIRKVAGLVDATNASLSMQQTLFAPSVRNVLVSALQFNEPHFRNAFGALALSFRDKSIAILDRFGAIELALTVVFVVVFLAAVAPLYLQLVTSLGRTVKAARILLTAFPEPLMFRMRSVQHEVQEIAHQFTSSHFMTTAAGSGLDSALASVLGQSGGANQQSKASKGM